MRAIDSSPLLAVGWPTGYGMEVKSAPGVAGLSRCRRSVATHGGLMGLTTVVKSVKEQEIKIDGPRNTGPLLHMRGRTGPYHERRSTYTEAA